MKILTTLLVASCFVCASTTISNAQDDEQNPQKLLIHVDHVIPAKAAQYEEANNGFVAALKEHGLKNADTWTHTQSNGDYMHVSRIEKMADLDSPPFKEVQEKMGKEAWSAMYSKFDGTYMDHESYIVNAQPKYSYNMDQFGAEGVNYRVWDFYSFEDKHWKEVMDLSKRWKELYESKKIESGYGTYTSGFGYPGPVIVVMGWAKSPAEYYAQIEKNQAILGDEGKKLWAETTKYMHKHERLDGWLRPDLSYITTNPDGTARGN